MFKFNFKPFVITLFSLSLPTLGHAKIDLVTLPNRDQVQLTIYNAADLTLVREQRTLTLTQGLNRLEFSWAGTLIDPTSVQLEAPQHSDQVKLLEVSYPPNITGSALWKIDSKIAGEIPVEITFFTSGLSWQSVYMATLSSDEKTMQLENYVRVDNNSGEDYAPAQTRVVVGKIQLLDEIAELARRQPPYGMPSGDLLLGGETLIAKGGLEEDSKMKLQSRRAEAFDAVTALSAKEIVKEGLSEYFLYTIEGTETILNGWGKRLRSFAATDIPIRTWYRYDEQRYGSNGPQQFLFFNNDETHHLGKTPLPDGNVTVYRQLPEHQHLTYIGEVYTQYIPIEQEVELNLGQTQQVKVAPVLMNYHTENYLFDQKGYVSGFDRVQHWQLKLANYRNLPADLEIFQHFPHAYWNIDQATDFTGQFEKVDLDTVKYTLTLPPQTKEYLLNYTLTLFEGERQVQVH